MSEAPVLYSVTNGVAALTLNRPAKLNALTTDMLVTIPKLLERSVKEGARSIVVRGNGRAFCSGAAMAGDIGNLGAEARLYYNPLAEAFANSPLPIVTAVNGAAAGAGAAIALWGDIVVAARSSYFLLAFANIGLVPDSGATWLVAMAAGRAKALEMALLGERMSAQEALAARLITRVVDDDELSAATGEIAMRLATRPTIAMGLIRRQIQVALDQGLASTLETEARHQDQAGESHDFKEGVRAFLEKRMPTFTGR